MYYDVEDKIKRHNKILFSRESECLQELRTLICEQSHITLVQWVFDCMRVPLDELIQKYPAVSSAANAYELSYAWAKGQIKMTDARKAILQCHAEAKNLSDPYYIALFHAIGQGCSTVHVETHALGLVFYELTAIVIKNEYGNYEDLVTHKIKYYIETLLFWQNKSKTYKNDSNWSAFLLRDGKQNKENQLINKKYLLE